VRGASIAFFLFALWPTLPDGHRRFRNGVFQSAIAPMVTLALAGFSFVTEAGFEVCSVRPSLKETDGNLVRSVQ
jgi:hypothetical protein